MVLGDSAEESRMETSLVEAQDAELHPHCRQTVHIGGGLCGRERYRDLTPICPEPLRYTVIPREKTLKRR
jgi:hypothetical protein